MNRSQVIYWDNSNNNNNKIKNNYYNNNNSAHKYIGCSTAFVLVYVLLLTFFKAQRKQNNLVLSGLI